MKFYLARHAEAEDGEQMDASRGLTKTGRKQIPVIADFLRTQTNRIGLVLCSPFTRGVDTAEPLADELGVEVEQTPILKPDAEPAKMWSAIKARAAKLEDGKELLVIGHGPSLNALCSYLLKSDEGERFHFSHGAVSHWDTEQPDGYEYAGRGGLAYLHWFASAKLMRRAMSQDRKAVIESALKVADLALELTE